MSEKTKRPELPYHAAGNVIMESHGIAIAQCFDRGYETPDVLALAAFFVRACNSHKALLDELKDMVQLVGTMTDLEPDEIKRIKKAESAIALAEKEQ